MRRSHRKRSDISRLSQPGQSSRVKRALDHSLAIVEIPHKNWPSNSEIPLPAIDMGRNKRLFFANELLVVRNQLAHQIIEHHFDSLFAELVAFQPSAIDGAG